MVKGLRSALYVVFVPLLLSFRLFGEDFGLHHFQPYIALFFALAALRKWSWLALSAVGYLVSTIVSTHLAGGVIQLWIFAPLLAFVLITFWGKCFSQRSGTPSLLAGSLGGAGIFYLVTNFVSWLTIPQYAKSLSGLMQALWTGIPGYPPTWSFFRNDAVAAVLFTAMILVINQLTFTKKEATAPSLSPS